MFPLEVVLIGRDEEVLESIRSELVANDAAVSAEFPDVPSTLENMEASAARRLFLFHVREAEDLRQLQKLVHALSGQPIMAVVDPELQEANDPVRTSVGTGGSTVARASLFVQAMRAGAMQVVPLPLESTDFREALECLARQCGHAAESTVIAVSGVQGGCGAPTLAIHLAHAISESSGRAGDLSEPEIRMRAGRAAGSRASGHAVDQTGPWPVSPVTFRVGTRALFSVWVGAVRGCNVWRLARPRRVTFRVERAVWQRFGLSAISTPDLTESCRTESCSARTLSAGAQQLTPDAPKVNSPRSRSS